MIQKYFKKLYQVKIEMSADINIICAHRLKEIWNQTELFYKNRSEKPDMCNYRDSVVILAAKLKNLIAADREDNWEGDLLVIPNLLPIFASLEAFRKGTS